MGGVIETLGFSNSIYHMASNLDIRLGERLNSEKLAQVGVWFEENLKRMTLGRKKKKKG